MFWGIETVFRNVVLHWEEDQHSYIQSKHNPNTNHCVSLGFGLKEMNLLFLILSLFQVQQFVRIEMRTKCDLFCTDCLFFMYSTL